MLGEICPKDITYDEARARYKKEEKLLNYPAFVCMAIVALTGLIFVFIVKRKNTKPRFVKIMWFIISVIFIMDTTMKLVKEYATDGHNTEIIYQCNFIQMALQ